MEEVKPADSRASRKKGSKWRFRFLLVFFVLLFCFHLYSPKKVSQEISFWLQRRELLSLLLSKNFRSHLSRLSDEDSRLQKELIPYFITALDDKDPIIQLAATSCLGKIARKFPEVLPNLIKQLEHHDGDIRLETLDSLIEIERKNKNQLLLPVIAERYKDKEQMIRSTVVLWVRILDNRSKKISTKLLFQALEDKEASISLQAITQLYWLPKSIYWSHRKELKKKILLKTLKNNDPKIREYAFSQLKDLFRWNYYVSVKDGEIDICQFILTGFKDPVQKVRLAAINNAFYFGRSKNFNKVLLALISILEDKDPEIRESAAISLGRLGNLAKEALPALKKGIKDKEIKVQKACKIAVKTISAAIK